jgi:hypothetical protein
MALSGYCPKCGREVVQTPNINFILFFILAIPFVIPAVAYMLYCTNRSHRCYGCGTPLQNIRFIDPDEVPPVVDNGPSNKPEAPAPDAKVPAPDAEAPDASKQEDEPSRSGQNEFGVVSLRIEILKPEDPDDQDCLLSMKVDGKMIYNGYGGMSQTLSLPRGRHRFEFTSNSPRRASRKNLDTAHSYLINEDTRMEIKLFKGIPLINLDGKTEEV